MKKRIFKVLSLVLALAMLGTFMAGCGSSGDDKSSGSKDTQTQSTEGFNPDNEKGVSIEDVRKDDGIEVPVKSGLKMGVVAKAFQNEFWRIFKTGYESLGDKLNKQGIDIKVDVQAPNNETDETGQLTIANNMINQSYDALLLSPISDANLTPAVETAKENKILTVNVNDGLIATADTFVGPRAYQAGELAAEWVNNKINGEGEVAIVIGMPKAFAARQRTAGFEEWCKKNASGINIVAKQNADWDRNKAKELTATWLQQHPNLKAIFCNNDTMALGVVEAIEEANADVLVVGVDGIGEAYDSIRAGKLDATIDSFPYYMSQIALECTLRSMAGQELPRVVWTPQAVIDKTNVDKEAKDIINWSDATYVAK